MGKPVNAGRKVLFFCRAAYTSQQRHKAGNIADDFCFSHAETLTVLL